MSPNAAYQDSDSSDLTHVSLESDQSSSVASPVPVQVQRPAQPYVQSPMNILQWNTLRPQSLPKRQKKEAEDSSEKAAKGEDGFDIL